MEYNNIWTRDKYVEFRKLKRNGYSQAMLIDYFGEAIYQSGIYNRKSSIMPWLNYIKEINVSPEKTDYEITKKASDLYLNKFDYVIKFKSDNVYYVIILFFYIIEDLETYNILMTTESQWNEYQKRLAKMAVKGYVTDEEYIELVNIVEKETGLNKLYSVIKKASYILLEIFKSDLDINIISLGQTSNLTKINLYRNIIKNSFSNITEVGEKNDEGGNKYFIYIINN
jgi:hypothetical protein